MLLITTSHIIFRKGVSSFTALAYPKVVCLHLLPCTKLPRGAEWPLWLSMVHLTRRADIRDNGSSLEFMMSINRADIARFLPREDASGNTAAATGSWF